MIDSNQNDNIKIRWCKHGVFDAMVIQTYMQMLRPYYLPSHVNNYLFAKKKKRTANSKGARAPARRLN